MSNDSRGSVSSDVPARRRRLWSLGYTAVFPLLFVVAVVAPFVVASLTSLGLFEAAEYTFVAVGVGYVVGLAVLLR
jgi:hypothetical protein